MNSNKKKSKIWMRIITIIIFVGLYFLFFSKIPMNDKVVVQKGDNFVAFTDDLWFREKLSLRTYLYLHRSIDLGKIQEWTYIFSGAYSAKDFVAKVLEGPTLDYIRYTVLEGRSIYDIDADLIKKWYIEAWDYISYVSDLWNISDLMQGFEFLRNVGNLNNLEWFLYPDTYFVDVGKPFSQQLVLQQLRAFDSKVWSKLEADILNFNNKLKLNGINITSLDMGPYEIITLASIIEKEERSNENKSTVAGLFLKRLQIWMRLDADITLCYGLQEGYESCTPELIAKNISDKNNPFNTRQQWWLPPQPIANPSFTSIDAVVNFEPSSYLYYLHDNDGVIHYWTNIQEHNANKNKYLK